MDCMWGENLYHYPTYSSKKCLTRSAVSTEMVLSGIKMPEFRHMPEEYHV